MNFDQTQLPAQASCLAPDQSEIRLLLTVKGCGLCHCTLPDKQTSKAVKHQTVEEIWYFIQGHGQVWRKLGNQQEVLDVNPGVSLNIPVETHFQFRNTSHEPLCFVIATVPPWPGPEEAVRVEDYWPTK
jgi:mannose-6-phosphate isomerase-like protein (cupin superfamily)